MRFDFRNKHLQDLYLKGASKKHKLPEGTKRKFFSRIESIKAAETVYDLWKLTSLRFKKLGGYENRYSIRVDKQWRLEIEIDWENEEKTKGVFHIVELSSHYGD